jgi:broad specificity phosphatase PhoE
VNSTTNMPPHIYLIRHGETAWSLSGQHMGRTDIALTERGEQKARELGERLRAVRFNRVLTSPLQRAPRTCNLSGLDSVAEVEPDLQEWDYGDYEGETLADIRMARPDWNLFRDGCPRGEAPPQVSERADRVIARIRGSDGNIAIFSHGHFGRVLAARWIGLPLTQAQHLLLNTGSVSILGFEHSRAEEPAIILWNAGSNEVFDCTPDQRVANKDAPLRKRAIERWENEGGKILETGMLNNPLPDRGSYSHRPSSGCGIIKMHLRKLEQLFDSLDHSPFREKDLDRNAEEYIVESFKEFPSRTTCELVIHLDQPRRAPDEENVVEEAVHVHFARRAQVLRHALRPLLRRGWISLMIGLTFLATFFLIGQFIRRMMGEGQLATLLRESLLIGGWVAMWKPLEIFLYESWKRTGPIGLPQGWTRTQ